MLAAGEGAEVNGGGSIADCDGVVFVGIAASGRADISSSAEVSIVICLVGVDACLKV